MGTKPQLTPTLTDPKRQALRNTPSRARTDDSLKTRTLNSAPIKTEKRPSEANLRNSTNAMVKMIRSRPLGKRLLFHTVLIGANLSNGLAEALTGLPQFGID